MNLIVIVWDVSPEIIRIGNYPARWYGLLFGFAFILGYYVMQFIYKREHVDAKYLESLFLYVALGGIIGARLGHCFFYDFQTTIENPLTVLYIWKGGLASHGGAIGILFSVLLYSFKYKYKPYIWIIDRIVIPISMGGALIRLGNLANSEIVGKTSELPWAFLFVNNPLYNAAPRHPAQLYEAIAYVLIFIFLLSLYHRKKGDIGKGIFLGWFLVLIFMIRFLIEFIKENQSRFEENMWLNMGQILSIPLVIIGLFLIFREKGKKIP
ncbi:MAG: prolipoprotein diacylglyceryl transferase [Bacteroidales bacterium]|nr:prolipoprotein diacylglyceryl transferase [Bacteroidales bacterium]